MAILFYKSDPWNGKACFWIGKTFDQGIRKKALIEKSWQGSERLLWTFAFENGHLMGIKWGVYYLVFYEKSDDSTLQF